MLAPLTSGPQGRQRKASLSLPLQTLLATKAGVVLNVSTTRQNQTRIGRFVFVSFRFVPFRHSIHGSYIAAVRGVDPSPLGTVRDPEPVGERGTAAQKGRRQHGHPVRWGPSLPASHSEMQPAWKAWGQVPSAGAAARSRQSEA